ncbi:MAG: HlyC/CorC family transporter [Verrucomicrobia bacterium]|nr:HlyC/CorC family transporter [Verrucomicrobiota bacterium]
MSNWAFFLFWTFFAVFVQGLFAMFEMACVSFNKVRLQYYVSLGSKRASWLKYFLKKPSRLFGTTMIGINVALQVGSEFSRRFYESIHLDPDWAPITQVLIVVMFGELAPMFAARRHSEQLAMALAPLMVLITRLISPIIWAFDAFSQLIHRMLPRAPESSLYLSREEVRAAFEEREESRDEFNAMVARVFRLKNLTASQVMKPLSDVLMAASTASVLEIKKALAERYVPILPIYHRNRNNIVAIVHLRDLLNKADPVRILDCSRPPWFITKDASILQILDQFRRNNQSMAIVLETSGQACGILTLDQILEQILGEEKIVEASESPIYIERTLPASMKVAEFNRQFQADLPHELDDTLEDLILRQLEHPPSKDETIRIGDFLFTVLETTLRGVKLLSVHSAE